MFFLSADLHLRRTGSGAGKLLTLTPMLDGKQSG